jgi:hypothetical protein
MTISNAYKDTLKKRAVSRFIKNNNRSPNFEELQDLLIREYRKYPSVDEVGVTGYDSYKPQYRNASSATLENENRFMLFDDMQTINERLSDITTVLEDSFRGFKNTTKRLSRVMRQLEGRVDNLLLINGNVDVFVHGIEETFDTQEYIDFDLTTAAIESSYCTIGRGGYTLSPLDNVSISTTLTSEYPIVGSQQTSDINTLKEDDGSFWEHLVYSKSKKGRVSSILQLDFPEPAYIGDLRIVASAISVNVKTTITIFYSLDGETYTAFEPAEQVMVSGEMNFNIGLDNIQKIQIIASKEAADNETVTANQYVYAFSYDSIKVMSDLYSDSQESELIAGPYPVTDELGNPVYFTKATLSACVNTPDDTAVSFYLSKDKSNWQPIDYLDQSVDYVSFGNSSAAGTSFRVESTQDDYSVVEEPNILDDLDFQTEAILNTAIDEDFADVVPIRSIVIKRNLSNNTVDSVYGASPGWFVDPITEEYTTTVYIDSDEGRLIDFGPTGIKVNGVLKKGTVELFQGYSILTTSSANWLEIQGDLTNSDALENADPLYPYNHKYLIEGYNYPMSFRGEKIYNGVDEYFGRLLEYIPPEKFNALDEVGIQELTYYTIDTSDGNLYFKIIVDKTYSSWKQELVSADWIVQADSTNEIYVKAVLTTSNREHTPIIEDYMVRVI